MMIRRTAPTRPAARAAAPAAARVGLIAALAAGVAAPVASPVAADVTGPQVWADWQAYMRGFGYEMTGTESQSGGTLTVTDVSMTVDMPEGEGSFAITLPRLGFVDNSDGSVTVELPDLMPMTFDVNPPEGEPARGTVNYAQTAPAMVVTGDPDDMTYTYSAEAVDVTLAALEVEGEPVTADMLSLAMRIADVSSVTRMQIGEMRSYTQDMSAAELTYDVAFVAPEEEGGGTGSLKGRMQGLEVDGTGDLPKATDATDMTAMVEAGMNVSGSFRYAAGGTDINLQSPDGPLVGTTASEGGTIAVAMGPDGLVYDVSQANVSIEMAQVPDLPFPLSLQMAKSALNLTMPLSAGEEPQDFAFGFTLGDFTVTDAIWNLFDPAGQLPRDPATIALDLTGKARMLVDMMDPEATAALGPDTAPGELRALDVNNLLVAAVGARLTGSGGFTFDNSDTETFDGMPRPQGALDIRVEGANALIDKLVQMGLLPEEQAQGARMMMGLFGVPQGEDVLTSTIEINEQGQILANGQRLQ